MVSSTVNQCCTPCTKANRSLAESQTFHAAEDDRAERRWHRFVALVGVSIFVVTVFASVAPLVAGWLA